MDFPDSVSVAGTTRRSAVADTRSVRAAVGRTTVCCAVALLVFSCAARSYMVRTIPTPDPPVRTGLPLDLRVSVEPGRARGFNHPSVVAAVEQSLEFVFSPDGHAHPNEGEASVRVMRLQAFEKQGVASIVAMALWYALLLPSGMLMAATPIFGEVPASAWVLYGCGWAAGGAALVIPDKSGQASAQVELEIRKPDGMVLRRYYGNGETRVSGRHKTFSAKSLAGDALADALDAVVQKVARDRDSIAADLE